MTVEVNKFLTTLNLWVRDALLEVSYKISRLVPGCGQCGVCRVFRTFFAISVCATDNVVFKEIERTRNNHKVAFVDLKGFFCFLFFCL